MVTERLNHFMETLLKIQIQFIYVQPKNCYLAIQIISTEIVKSKFKTYILH